MLETFYTANLSERQRAMFAAEYEQRAKKERTGMLFAALLGSFGIHRFYLGETGAGVLYIVFSWTGVPALLGLIECFYMRGRVRAYNSAVAQQIIAEIAGPRAATFASAFASAEAVTARVSCPRCGEGVDTATLFCPHCGAATGRLV